MKLDATDLRYLSNEDFRVLSAVEQGSKNHEVVPLGLIAQLSGSRSGGVNKSLGELAKRSLVGKVQNAKYDGYRLTYGGYDFLACRTFSKRDTIYSVGNQIGTGKESDIYVVANAESEQHVLKIQRLGRVSFRNIKSKRDYLRKGQSASWMYMSRLAAKKEYAFMEVLHQNGFPVPKPIDQNRHCIVMEFIDAYPLRQIAHIPNPGKMYSDLMDLIVRFARAGLIHGDYNEFNILIKDHRTDAEKDRDDETPEERDARIEAEGGDFPVTVPDDEMTDYRRENGVLEPIVIDFPQMVSTDHYNAEFYFNRDVNCIRKYFRKRFKYESSVYPRFRTVMRDGVRDFDLDVQVSASGFTNSDREALEQYMEEVRLDEEDGESGSESDESDVEATDRENIEENDDDDLPDLSNLRLSKDAFGNDVYENDSSEELQGVTRDQSKAADGTLDGIEGEAKSNAKPERQGISESEEAVEEECNAESGDEDPENVEQLSSDEAEAGTEGKHKQSHKRRKPKTVDLDIEQIVTGTLNRNKRISERRHHGKKPVSSHVLGKQKGSKKKNNAKSAVSEFF